jgi:hypothetical protein
MLEEKQVLNTDSEPRSAVRLNVLLRSVTHPNSRNCSSAVVEI